MTEPSNPPKESLSPQPPVSTKRSWLRRILLIVAGIFIVAFIGIQLIPVNRSDPPVTTQIQWDSPQTEALTRRACMDCHSNETTWPIYSYVAPASWLIYYDVQRGRSEWNISTVGSSSEGNFNNPFNQSNDLAYRLGQFLAGNNRRGRPGGQFNGEFPRNFSREQPAGGELPRSSTGQQPPNGGFPSGGFGDRMAERVTEAIQSGQMPPATYTTLHPSAKLTDQERQQLIQGLTATLGSTSP